MAADNFDVTKHRVGHSFDKNGFCVWCRKSRMYHSNPPKTPYCEQAPAGTVEFWRKGAADQEAKEAAARHGLDAFHRGYRRGGFA